MNLSINCMGNVYMKKLFFLVFVYLFCSSANSCRDGKPAIEILMRSPYTLFPECKLKISDKTVLPTYSPNSTRSNLVTSLMKIEAKYGSVKGTYEGRA